MNNRNEEHFQTSHWDFTLEVWLKPPLGPILDVRFTQGPDTTP